MHEISHLCMSCAKNECIVRSVIQHCMHTPDCCYPVTQKYWTIAFGPNPTSSTQLLDTPDLEGRSVQREGRGCRVFIRPPSISRATLQQLEVAVVPSTLTSNSCGVEEQPVDDCSQGPAPLPSYFISSLCKISESWGAGWWVTWSRIFAVVHFAVELHQFCYSQGLLIP